MKNASVTLKKNKEDALKRRHPWIFSGAIHKKDQGLTEGDLVKVLDSKGTCRAWGHYQDGSICVRILSFEKNKPGEDFWKKKIADAAALRRQLRFPSGDNTSYRLVFGEGDRLPGLVIDWYDGTAVVQCHSIGMLRAKDDICQALKDVFGKQLKAVYHKSGGTLPKNSDFAVEDGYLYGEGELTVVKENGNLFEIDWVKGQKTGFFIDQRDNRALLARYSKGKKVLNTFCYSGGFSVYALKGGATQVDSVDVSAKAIALTDRNMELNAPDGYNGSTHVADTFDYLKENGDEYDIVVLDPPAFAKHRDVRHKAVIGYKRLNEMALKKIKPGGLLFTFSCSQVVDRALFENTIRAAAIESGRDVSILHYMTQPADHPVNIYHPEGEYLTGLVLKIGK